jgi:hypothetical protein
MYSNAKALFNLTNDQEWFDLLTRSVNEPIVNGIGLPRFPHARVQEQWVGSSDAHALSEAFNFYRAVKGYAKALGMPLHANSKILDFGAGWGRFTRVFWNDVDEAGIFGVDTDPDIVATCRALGNVGKYDCIQPRGSLPYSDKSFDLIFAYSVFSHLPEAIAQHWIDELHRVARPGCVFALTTEPRRFLDFIAGIEEPAASDWYAGLAAFKLSIPQLLQDFEQGKFCYLPTSGGEHREASIYGDAVIPESYIRRVWGQQFNVAAYVDDPNHFWQAFVVMQRQ